ncbi:MAG: erythromycin esterase family protein [Prevotella sp.]|nr:erythromycin esterase family protein [Prevotella sp.]
MKRFQLYLLLFVIFFHINKIYGQTYEERYNLDFAHFNDSVSNWTFYINQSSVMIDSTVVYHRKHPLKISPQKKWARLQFPASLSSTLFNMILLPEAPIDTIEIRMTSKQKNLKQARLLIDRISKHEKILFTDTLSANLQDTTWNTASIKIPASDVKLLNLRLGVYGRNDKKDPNRELAIWLDRVEILADGRSLNEFALPIIEPFSVSESEEIKTLSFEEDLYGNIEELKSKKIVALGETVHGSGTVNRAAAQIIKHRVLNNDCRLVLLELPFETMMFLNKEIQGEEVFKGDSILKNLGMLFDASVLDDLVSWLKQYNDAHPNDKVTLMGMDLNFLDEDNYKQLAEYVTCLNQTKKNKLLLDLSALLSKILIDKPSSVLAFLQQHPEIKNILGNTEFELIKHNLEMSQKATMVPEIRLHYRDSIMKENAVFLTNLFAPQGKTVTIWTHFLHANHSFTSPSAPVRSFGSYMGEHYGDEYSCIGITVGNGIVTTASLTKDGKAEFVDHCILPPINGSVEDFFNEYSGAYVYCHSDFFNDGIQYIRYIGQPYSEKKQFELMNPKARMDGIIFINDSEGLSKSLSSANQ